jgi:hypothetical protein
MILDNVTGRLRHSRIRRSPVLLVVLLVLAACEAGENGYADLRDGVLAWNARRTFGVYTPITRAYVQAALALDSPQVMRMSVDSVPAAFVLRVSARCPDLLRASDHGSPAWGDRDTADVVVAYRISPVVCPGHGDLPASHVQFHFAATETDTLVRRVHFSH